MREEQIFAKTLEELSALAKEQGNMLSEEQVTEAFDKANLNLGEPQLEMIFAYLKNKKIGIGQPADPFDYMSRRSRCRYSLPYPKDRPSTLRRRRP